MYMWNQWSLYIKCSEDVLTSARFYGEKWAAILVCTHVELL